MGSAAWACERIYYSKYERTLIVGDDRPVASEQLQRGFSTADLEIG